MDFPDPNSDLDNPEPAPVRERPSRDARTRRSRGSGGGGGPRQQLMARRAVALGVGLIVLILLVFGAKGCLDARKNRSLEDYAGTVTQIVDETNALSNTFFNRLEDPKDLGIPDFNSEIESDRSAMDGFLSRVEKLDTPGDMKGAQDTLLLTYQLRAGALNIIAEKMPTATGKEGTGAAIKVIAKQMQVLSAADVLYNQVTRHQIDNTIANNGASAPEMPRSSFVPDVATWVNPDEIESALGKLTGATADTASDGGVHGTGLESAAIGAITLDASVATTVPAGTEPAVIVSVMNQGEADESDVEVSVSVDGTDPITSSIPSIAPGETGQATVTLTPAPTGTVTLDVAVAAVPGEKITENNEASYQVTFE